jgi:hypothetical protein
MFIKPSYPAVPIDAMASPEVVFAAAVGVTSVALNAHSLSL